MARVRRVEQPLQLLAQPLPLLVAQDGDAGDVAVLVKETHLLVAEPVAPPLGGRRRAEAAQRLGVSRKIVVHGRLLPSGRGLSYSGAGCHAHGFAWTWGPGHAHAKVWA